MDTKYTEHQIVILYDVNKTQSDYSCTHNIVHVSHSDVVEEFGHMFDDVTVLWWLSLQKFLDDHHTLRDNSLYKDKKHVKTPILYDFFFL